MTPGYGGYVYFTGAEESDYGTEVWRVKSMLRPGQ